MADCVRQRADALMLSSESAMGLFPDKALGVLRSVATHMEQNLVQGKGPAPPAHLPEISSTSDGRASEEICGSANLLANRLGAVAIFCFTRRGFMANFLSRCDAGCKGGDGAVTAAWWLVPPLGLRLDF